MSVSRLTGLQSPYNHLYSVGKPPTEKSADTAAPSHSYQHGHSYGDSAGYSNALGNRANTENESSSYGSGAPTPLSIAYPKATAIEKPQLDPVNNSADRQALAEKHAPILVLPDSKDQNDLDDLPASAQEFIDNSQLKEDKFGRDRIIGDNYSDDDPDFSADRLATDPENYYLDLEDDLQKTLGRPQDSDKGPAELHYQFEENNGRPMLTYHIFYANNDGPGPQNHEGDWERITLELDPGNFEPIEVRMNSHNHRTDAVWKNPSEGEVEIEKVGDRPVVYIASGSHASFPRPGSYYTEQKPIQDHTPESKDDAVIYDDWGGLLDVTEQSWYPEEGKGIRWGEQGFKPPKWNDSSSGPHGPSPEKGFLNDKENPEWADGYHDSWDTSFLLK